VIDSAITRGLPFHTAGCVGAKVHRPMPLISELHHVFPLYLQARIWTDVDSLRPGTAHVKEFATLCGNCHATVHVVIASLLLQQHPPHAPTKLTGLAYRAIELYAKAKAA
jgi:hypothetical protein